MKNIFSKTILIATIAVLSMSFSLDASARGHNNNVGNALVATAIIGAMLVAYNPPQYVQPVQPQQYYAQPQYVQPMPQQVYYEQPHYVQPSRYYRQPQYVQPSRYYHRLQYNQYCQCYE